MGLSQKLDPANLPNISKIPLDPMVSHHFPNFLAMKYGIPSSTSRGVWTFQNCPADVGTGCGSCHVQEPETPETPESGNRRNPVNPKWLGDP